MRATYIALLHGSSLRFELCCLDPSSLNRPDPPHSRARPNFTSSAYMGRLRCAGAPRRPASGSALYLPDLSQHVVLYVPGEPLAAYIQFLRDAHLPSPTPTRLGAPDVGRCRGLLVHHCYNLLSCSPPSQETFTSELSTVWSPSPLPGITTVATGQFPPAGLTPAGPTTSVAAQLPPPHLSP